MHITGLRFSGCFLSGYISPHPVALVSLPCNFGVGEAGILFHSSHSSHAHAFNFYHGVELYPKAQISAVQLLFGGKFMCWLCAFH